jgi:CheY-like chemotaxis protein
MSKPFALIVEDHVDAAVIFTEALKKTGYETDTVRTGDAALARLATSVPDLVILDLSLPRVSGVQILDEIRADPRLARTRVLVATAHPQMADTIRAKADLVLVKPISYTQLREVVGGLGIGAEGRAS